MFAGFGARGVLPTLSPPLMLVPLSLLPLFHRSWRFRHGMSTELGEGGGGGGGVRGQGRATTAVLDGGH